jgi:Na+/glutamate symporter
VAPTITKLVCLALGAALGILFGVGIGGDVRRWLRERRQQARQHSAKRLRVVMRGLQ